MPDNTLNYAGIPPLAGYLTPGAKIAAYVRSTGAAAGDNEEITSRLYTTVNAALAQVRSGYGDIVVVLPGHTESISSADHWNALKAGTRIVGFGIGASRPTFTWTIATSTVLLDVANVSIENCILNLEPGTGTVTVTAPITISAAGCALIGNLIKFGTDANNKVTIGITTAAAADDLLLDGNTCIAATAAECTTFMDLIGCDRLAMRDNVFMGATSAAGVGIVRFATTASTFIRLERNTYVNKKALSQCAVTGLANVSGVSRDEHFAYLDTASLTPWLTSTGIMTFHRPTVTNTGGETGTEVVGTVSA
jgi:hypothetical protein